MTDRELRADCLKMAVQTIVTCNLSHADPVDLAEVMVRYVKTGPDRQDQRQTRSLTSGPVAAAPAQ